MPTGTDILRSYRELIYVMRRLPEASRGPALAEARRKVRENASVSEEAEISELHKLMVSKIGYIRLSHPRRGSDKYIKGGTFVMRDGKLLDQPGRHESR